MQSRDWESWEAATGVGVRERLETYVSFGRAKGRPQAWIPVGYSFSARHPHPRSAQIPGDVAAEIRGPGGIF